MGRELTFADPKIQGFIKENFVAVAGDDWYERRRRDAEGEFFRKVADQGPRKGAGGSTRQGIYVLTPSGTLLGYKNHQDPAVMYAFFRNAYFAWRSLPLTERDPGAVKIGDPGKPDPRFHRAPPANGLVLSVYTRILDRESDGTCRPGTCRFPGGQRAAHDHLWLTEEDWKALIPAKPRSGDSFTVPSRVARRIARFHLADNTRGEPNFWERKEIHSGELKLTVEDVNTEAVKLRVDGSFLLANATDPAQAKRGYDVRLLGFIQYNREKKAIERFDMVALGDHWGEGTYTAGARPGRSPLGVAFELATRKNPADRVPPQAAREWTNYMGAE